MRADKDIQLARRQPSQRLFNLAGRSCTTDIIEGAGKILQSPAERLIVLKSQHRRRHEHSHLFIVCNGFEGRTDRDLRLAETDIAANQPVHRPFALHIGFDVSRRLHLVGRIFVDETGFKLILHEAVRTERIAFLLSTLRIEFDQIAGNIFDFLLRAVFHLLPCTAAQLVQRRRFAVFPFVFRQLMERMNTDEEDIVVTVNQLDGFLYLAVHLRAHKSAKLPDAMIDMHDIVAGSKLAQFFEREHYFPAARLVALEVVLMKASENLMIGQEAAT